jgi:uncharacterized protein (DUF58 family)
MTRFWVAILLLLALIGLIASDLLLLWAALLALAALAVAAVWRELALRDVTYERILEPSRLFPGEQCALRVRLENHKLLPVAWMSVVERLRSGLIPFGERERRSGPREFAWKQTYALGPFERVERTLQLEASERGRYRLDPVVATAGDPFGMFSTTDSMGATDEVIVYPALLPPWSWAPAAARPFGETRAVVRTLEDPMRSAGVRRYIAGDPMRRVHWRATARTGRLMSRVFEPSADLQLLIALDSHTSEEAWHGVDHDMLEHGISLAATAARDALEARVAVGLFSNALLVGSDQRLRLAPGRALDQLTAVLESLALLIPFFGPTLADVLDAELAGAPFGASLLVISHASSERFAAVLERYRRRGHPVLLCDPATT